MFFKLLKESLTKDIKIADLKERLENCDRQITDNEMAQIRLLRVLTSSSRARAIESGLSDDDSALGYLKREITDLTEYRETILTELNVIQKSGFCWRDRILRKKDNPNTPFWSPLT